MGEPKVHPYIARLYPRVRPTEVVVVAGVIALVVVVVLVILNLPGNGEQAEGRGDLTYIEGKAPRNRQGAPQLAASIADLTRRQRHSFERLFPAP